MGKGSIKKASSKAKAQSNSRPTPKKASKKNANAPALTGAKSTLPTSTPLTSNLIKVSKKVNLKHLETQLPKLNTIVPAGVVKPKGKKKGKVFVDDRETMKRILAVVSEAVEGKEQGKIERQRNLEIIREAKREEAERKEGQKQEKLERAKQEIKNKRKRKSGGGVSEELKKQADETLKEIQEGNKSKKQKKKVSFA